MKNKGYIICCICIIVISVVISIMLSVGDKYLDNVGMDIMEHYTSGDYTMLSNYLTKTSSSYTLSSIGSSCNSNDQKNFLKIVSESSFSTSSLSSGYQTCPSDTGTDTGSDPSPGPSSDPSPSGNADPLNPQLCSYESITSDCKDVKMPLVQYNKLLLESKKEQNCENCGNTCTTDDHECPKCGSVIYKNTWACASNIYNEIEEKYLKTMPDGWGKKNS